MPKLQFNVFDLEDQFGDREFIGQEWLTEGEAARKCKRGLMLQGPTGEFFEEPNQIERLFA